MDYEQLKRSIRESYPFPIAHAHKKTLGVLDDNVEKLKCILETAEATIRFLALLALAQVRQDALNGNAPNVGRLQEEIKLATPSFGKWNRLTREVMKAYSDAKDQLVVPELFDVFWFYDTSRQRLCSQRLDNKVIGPLITLRNDFHHGRVPDNKVREKVAEGLGWLHQFLEALQFLAQYELSYIQQIRVAQRDTSYVHDLTLFTGYVYEPERRTYAMQMDPGSLIFLHVREGRHLRLEPFLIYTDHLKGPDIFLLNNFAKKKASYVSSQFVGEELRTTDKEWPDGTAHYQTLNEFFDVLQNVPQASSLAKETEKDQEGAQAETLAVHEEEESLLSTAEVFDQKYRAAKHVMQHTSPYKFLDYYNPEDQDIFFGRDKEVRILQQKFYSSRLLVLHGESGTGKTSLVRAGLIPRLDQESYIPVYVRVLKEPLCEIKRELIRQLFVVRHEAQRSAVEEERHSTTLRDLLRTDVPLAEFLMNMTERVSKTVVIVLDQFEEFFLRFPEEVREQFEKELATCVETPRLDVKFLISLRADYFSYLAMFEASIPHIFTHQLQLERLTEAQALKAVIKPAERLRIQVDEIMVQIKLLPELLSEEGNIEPPFLQIVCDALYQNAQSEGRSEIGMVDYEAIGDVKSCLGKYLDTKLRQFGTKQGTAKAMLKALVTAEGTKRASFVEELMSRIQSVGLEITEEELKKDYLDKFVRDRLVRVEDVEGRARYELSHEYLVKHIEAWIEESEREITKVLELIDRAYEAYQATDLLLESSALQMIKPFEEQIILPPDKQAFVDRSKTQVRKKRRGLLLKVVALLMFVALVIGGIFGYQTYQAYLESEKQREIAMFRQWEAEEQRQRAEQQTEIAIELARKNLRKSELNEIEELNLTSEVLFVSHDELDALLASVKAGITSKYKNIPTALKNQTMFNLGKIVNGVRVKNRLEGHESRVWSVSFSPDGTLLASGSWDNTIKLWNADDGRELATLHGHSDRVYSVTFSPDGTLLASGSADKTIRLWNVTDGQEIRTLHGHSDEVWSVTFSPDGTLLASGSRDKTIKLWKVADGREIRTLQGHSVFIRSVTFSPDNTILASGGGEEVKLWRVADGREIRTLHADTVISITFNPDGTLLASGSGEEVKLWRVADGQELTTLHGHSGVVGSVSFSPDGTLLASGSGDKTIRLWNVADGRELTTLRHSDFVLGVDFSPDGTLLASGSLNKTIKLWNVADNWEIPILHGHASRVASVTFSPDGTLLASGSADHTIKLWKVADGREIRTLRGHSDHVYSVAFSSDGTLLASGSRDRTIKLWNVADGREIRTLQGHSHVVSSVSFSPDGTLLASGSWDNTIKLWNVSDGREIGMLHGDTRSVAFSPDGSLLASGGDEYVKLWRVADGREITTLHGHSSYVMSVMFSPDGTILASGSEDRTIKLWNVANGQEITTLHGHSGRGVVSIGFSPDGSLLASGSWDHTIKLWNVADSQEITTLSGHSDAVWSVSFSPDGRRLASGSDDRTIKLWNVDLEMDILEMGIDELLVRGCGWLHGYLKNNPNVSDVDRAVCDDVLKNYKD